MRKNTIDVITLGCSKNLVDSEKLMRQLEANGYKVTHDTDRPQGEIAVINTCGFIGDAKEESINMILEFCQAKEEGRLKKLFVVGCLSERYLKELGELAEINEPVRETYYKGNERIDEVTPKYALLSTHAGRKTFICNALALGIPAPVVMKWTQ